MNGFGFDPQVFPTVIITSPRRVWNSFESRRNIKYSVYLLFVACLRLSVRLCLQAGNLPRPKQMQPNASQGRRTGKRRDKNLHILRAVLVTTETRRNQLPRADIRNNKRLFSNEPLFRRAAQWNHYPGNGAGGEGVFAGSLATYTCVPICIRTVERHQLSGLAAFLHYVVELARYTYINS